MPIGFSKKDNCVERARSPCIWCLQLQPVPERGAKERSQSTVMDEIGQQQPKKDNRYHMSSHQQFPSGLPFDSFFIVFHSDCHVSSSSKVKKKKKKRQALS